jgi:mRNA interferase RelE/StbE
MYKIVFVSGLDKELKKIPKADQKRIIKKIETLSDNPFPEGCKALQGSLSGYHRIRCGWYRIVYEVNKEQITILIVKIGHRSHIYEM